MKKIILFLLGAAFTLGLTAGPVNVEQAMKIARNFYLQSAMTQTLPGSDLVLAFTVRSKDVALPDGQDTPLLYVFNINRYDGFVIVAADDAVVPVLGYAVTGTFSEAEAPPAFRKLIEKYKKEIIHVIINNLPAGEEIQNEWARLERGEAMFPGRATEGVNPLVTTQWPQAPLVNDLCPYDINAGPDNDYHCVTGCPATAMAQIMKFWNYPATGTGFHSYNHNTYGTLSANFAATSYNWGAMPDHVTTYNEAVATLMFHCGVSVEMDYGPTSSGSYVIIDGSPTPQQCSEYAYKTYFGYNPNTIHGYFRDNYSDTQWDNLMKTELDAGRPVQYAGFGQGGHTFVADGYDNNDMFHINWGWGGYADGYYYLNALNPGEGGTGGGAGTYNEGQQAVIGIQPNSAAPAGDLTVYSPMTVNNNPIGYTDPFSVNVDIANMSSTTFHGDFTVGVFDTQGMFVDYVQIYSNMTLEPGNHYVNGLTFTSWGIVAAIPGQYILGVLYRPTGGDWAIVPPGSYNNTLSFTVVSQPNSIKLDDDLIIQDNLIIVGQPVTVTTSIKNYGMTQFSGSISMDLFDMEGMWVATIQQYNGVSISSYGTWSNVIFSSSGISIPPGNYYLVAMDWVHNTPPDEWLIVSGDYYPNPITVTVANPPLSPDAFEPDNTVDAAYNLSVSFSGNSADVNTTGSNIHTGDDLDYYRLSLPSGYDYTIAARVHDSYNSGNGNTYTCDVMFAYECNDVWSDTYDDIMPSDIVIHNGGTLIFNVAPYFAGGTGTYLLDIPITRTPSGGIENIIPPDHFSVFPVPAGNVLSIVSEQNETVKSIEILDVLGQQVVKIEYHAMQESRFEVPVGKLEKGVYLILIRTENGLCEKKFIKS